MIEKKVIATDYILLLIFLIDQLFRPLLRLFKLAFFTPYIGISRLRKFPAPSDALVNTNTNNLKDFATLGLGTVDYYRTQGSWTHHSFGMQER